MFRKCRRHLDHVYFLILGIAQYIKQTWQKFRFTNPKTEIFLFWKGKTTTSATDEELSIHGEGWSFAYIVAWHVTSFRFDEIGSIDVLTAAAATAFTRSRYVFSHVPSGGISNQLTHEQQRQQYHDFVFLIAAAHINLYAKILIPIASTRFRAQCTVHTHIFNKFSFETPAHLMLHFFVFYWSGAWLCWRGCLRNNKKKSSGLWIDCKCLDHSKLHRPHSTNKLQLKM